MSSFSLIFFEASRFFSCGQKFLFKCRLEIDVSTFNDTKLNLFNWKCKFFTQKMYKKIRTGHFAAINGSRPKACGELNALKFSSPPKD